MKLPFQKQSRRRPPQPYSEMSRHKSPRTEEAAVTESICPYCAVGCGLLVHTKGDRIINIEGNPESPINEGTLCPKGANSIQLAVNPHRVTHVMYRAPYSDGWERKSLDWALDRIAKRVKEARDADYEEKNEQDITVNCLKSVGTLGGAVLDNEENYLMKKLFAGGLGMVSVENQARI
jgi:formate dehydrogenase major subunit